MTATVELSPPRPRLLVAAAVVPLVALGVVVTAVLFLVAGIWGLLAGLVITAGVVALRARALTTGIRRRVLASLDPRPADATTESRLVNLADGLSATSGVPVPDLFVLDDPGANMLVVGEALGHPGPGRHLRPARGRSTASSSRPWSPGRSPSCARASCPAASVAVTTVARSAITLAGGGPGALAVRPVQRALRRRLRLRRRPRSRPPPRPGRRIAHPLPAGPAQRPRPHRAGRHHRRPGPPRVGAPLDGRPRAWPCRACRRGPRSSSASRPCASSERQVSPTTPRISLRQPGTPARRLGRHGRSVHRRARGARDGHPARQAGPGRDAQGRRHHGRRRPRAGQDRRGRRRRRRHGARAGARRHPPRRRRRPHERSRR